jgi:hypothetical protein
MGKTKDIGPKEPIKRPRPALSPEAREQQLVGLAYDLAEKQLLEGTASSQVITQFLKMGSKEQQRKVEKLEEENKLLRAKTESLQMAKNTEEMYTKAIQAMQLYSGINPEPVEGDEGY